MQTLSFRSSSAEIQLGKSLTWRLPSLFYSRLDQDAAQQVPWFEATGARPSTRRMHRQGHACVLRLFKMAEGSEIYEVSLENC